MLLTLTSKGKNKAKDIAYAGLDSSLVAMLDENGPSEISELSRDMKVSQKSVRSSAIRLAKQGLIRRDES